MQPAPMTCVRSAARRCAGCRARRASTVMRRRPQERHAPAGRPADVARAVRRGAEPDDIPDDADAAADERAAAHAAGLQCAALSAAAAARAPRSARRADRATPQSAGVGDAAGDARLSAGVGARPLGERRRAAGGAALVRRAGHRDQADRLLFVPRNGRRRQLEHVRARLRRCARHRRLHARRRPHDHGQGRLARLAGRAGLPARRAGSTPARRSPRCWRPATTSITTTTSTWT